MSIEIVKEGNPEFDKKNWPYMLKEKGKEIGFVFF